MLNHKKREIGENENLGFWQERKRNLPGKIERMELEVCWERERTAVAVEYGAWRYFKLLHFQRLPNTYDFHTLKYKIRRAKLHI